MKLPFVSRDRYEAAQVEVRRLTARVAALEQMLDARSMGVLQSVLRKHGYAMVGEEMPAPNAMTESAPPWTNLDYRVYDTWVRDYREGTGGTEQEAREEYRRTYGDRPPSKTLIV